MEHRIHFLSLSAYFDFELKIQRLPSDFCIIHFAAPLKEAVQSKVAVCLCKIILFLIVRGLDMLPEKLFGRS
jgi:hypothetical protein